VVVLVDLDEPVGVGTSAQCTVQSKHITKHQQTAQTATEAANTLNQPAVASIFVPVVENSCNECPLNKPKT
jgi:hypothetical protein